MNRPGLALSGFTRYFCLQAHAGHAATPRSSTSANQPGAEARAARYANLFALQNPVRRLQPQPASRTRSFWRRRRRPACRFFRSPLVTMKFINLATLALETMFAPRGTETGQHGGHPRRRRHHPRRKRHRQKRSVLALIERGYSLRRRRRHQGHAGGRPRSASAPARN